MLKQTKYKVCKRNIRSRDASVFGMPHDGFHIQVFHALNQKSLVEKEITEGDIKDFFGTIAEMTDEQIREGFANLEKYGYFVFDEYDKDHFIPTQKYLEMFN